MSGEGGASAARGRAEAGVGGLGVETRARYLDRDLAWLAFNGRVLAQAADERLPLLERVKFLAIFTSNLDEFFMKRVALLKRQAMAASASGSATGPTARQQLAEVRRVVQQQQEEQARIFTQELRPALAGAGIHLVAYAELSGKERSWAAEWFRSNVFPALTPLAVDQGHRFPFISNLSENYGLLAEVPGNGGPRFARVKVPTGMTRYVALPGKGGPADRFISLDELIRAHLGELFHGAGLSCVTHFRVTRSAGVQREEAPEDQDASLLESVEAELKQRRFARPVRLEIEPDPSPEIQRQLLDRLRLEPNDVYEQRGLMEYTELFEIAELDRPDLKWAPWRGVTPPALADARASIFGAIKRRDVLLHHPYESFNASVERFIAAAAADPDVLTIKQTLYRTSPDSPFIESLIKAAESGKSVACLVELRARFDEGRNVRFARQLERAGVHVAYGVVGLKTHCKTSLVVRRESRALRCYAHIGTGNYHPKTAQLYTDVGLLTCDPEITGDLVSLFNYLTGVAVPRGFDHLLVAPFNMRERFNAMIDREMEHARAAKEGRGPGGRIVAKLNSLEDRKITERLYEASRAGVEVMLIVRGFCCLRPGVPGLSDNIRVMSVVGRFLEHSRIFHFGCGREDPLDGEWYIGSADWMYRNLNARVECIVPVRDPQCRARLLEIIRINTEDQRQAWDMFADGSYLQRRSPTDGDPALPAMTGSFEALMRAAKRSAK
jgi:polyphosphate kinase